MADRFPNIMFMIMKKNAPTLQKIKFIRDESLHPFNDLIKY